MSTRHQYGRLKFNSQSSHTSIYSAWTQLESEIDNTRGLSSRYATQIP